MQASHQPPARHPPSPFPSSQSQSKPPINLYLCADSAALSAALASITSNPGGSPSTAGGPVSGYPPIVLLSGPAALPAAPVPKLVLTVDTLLSATLTYPVRSHRPGGRAGREGGRG